MNTDNGTIVSGEFYKKLKEAGLDDGYVEVPKPLQRTAEQILAGREVATMTAGFQKRARYLARKRKLADGNRRHEDRLREARERLHQ